MDTVYSDDAALILHGDSACLKEIPVPGARSVDLILTSPPYNAGMAYDGGGDDLPDSEYWSLIHAVARNVFEVARPGAFAAFNVPLWIGSRPKRFLVSPFMTEVERAGWVFKDWITWVKGKEGGEEPNSTGWVNFPTTPAIRSAIEPILIFRKDGGRVREIPDITWAEWAKFTIGVWHFGNVHDDAHPAVFPLQIPERLIRLYTAPGETVLDPFMGTGTTLRAAKNLGRKAIGIDKSLAYCKVAAGRLRQGVLI